MAHQGEDADGEAVSAFFDANRRVLDQYLVGQAELVRASATLASSERQQVIVSVAEANRRVLEDFFASQEAALKHYLGKSNGLASSAQPSSSRREAQPPPPPSGAGDAAVIDWLKQEISRITGFPAASLDERSDFERDLGLDSISMLEILVAAEKRVPELKRHRERFHGVRNLGDVAALLHLAAAGGARTPPAAAPTPAAPPVTADGQTATQTASTIIDWVRSEIARITGFPREALGEATELERDLGLDSVSRLEILASAAKRFPELRLHGEAFYGVNTIGDLSTLLSRAEPAVRAPTPRAPEPEPRSDDLLATLQRDLLRRLAETCGPGAPALTPGTPFNDIAALDVFARERVLEGALSPHPALSVAGREVLNARSVEDVISLLRPFAGADTAAALTRYVLREVPFDEAPRPLPRRVLLAGVTGPVFERLRQSLGELGVDVLPVALAESWQVGADRIALDDTTALARHLARLLDDQVPPVVYVASPGGRPLEASTEAWSKALDRVATGFLVLLQALAPRYGAKDGARLAVVGHTDDAAPGAAARAMARCVQREWRGSTTRALWLAGPLEAVPAARLVGALFGAGPEHNLVLEGTSLRRRELVARPAGMTAPRSVDRGALVLLTGGGDGITAEIACALAERHGCQIAAVGRTPFPASRPYDDIEDAGLLRARILEEVKNDPTGAPFQERWRLVSRHRGLWRTRQRVEAAGCAFHYFEADVRDSRAMARVIEQLKAGVGPIRGLVHGAGFIEDAPLAKKSVASFRRVLEVKALSAHILYRLLHDSPLAFAFLFSSVSSYVGRPGQLDYAAANEVLNEVAAEWNRRVAYPVRSLLWSVWNESGLAAGPLLKSIQARYRLPGTSNAEGVGGCLTELERGDKADPWVLLTPAVELAWALEDGHDVAGVAQ